MKKGFNWAIVISAILGFIIGLITGWAVWAFPTPVQADSCEKVHSACDVNHNDKLCCEGLVCVDKGLPSDVGKCEVAPSEECEYFNPELANLYAKDPVSWERVWGGYGQLDLEGNIFIANRLQPRAKYSLIIYDTVLDVNEDEWPGEEYKALASGMADECGNLELKFELPFCLDEAKIWLVLASDYNDNMTAWKPQSYLFEHDRFNTCEPEPTVLVCLDGEEELTIPRTAEAWKRVLYSWPSAYLGECDVPDVPPPPVEEPKEEHHEAPMPSAPEICANVPTPENPANFHLYRKGDCAELKWLPTDGDTVNIYWKNPASGNWEHSVINSDNDGVELVCGLGGYDWTFGLAQVNGECNQSDIMEVEDGNTPDWVLFR